MVLNAEVHKNALRKKVNIKKNTKKIESSKISIRINLELRKSETIEMNKLI